MYKSIQGRTIFAEKCAKKIKSDLISNISCSNNEQCPKILSKMTLQLYVNIKIIYDDILVAAVAIFNPYFEISKYCESLDKYPNSLVDNYLIRK